MTGLTVVVRSDHSVALNGVSVAQRFLSLVKVLVAVMTVALWTLVNLLAAIGVAVILFVVVARTYSDTVAEVLTNIASQYPVVPQAAQEHFQGPLTSIVGVITLVVSLLRLPTLILALSPEGKEALPAIGTSVVRSVSSVETTVVEDVMFFRPSWAPARPIAQSWEPAE